MVDIQHTREKMAEQISTVRLIAFSDLHNNYLNQEQLEQICKKYLKAIDNFFKEFEKWFKDKNDKAKFINDWKLSNLELGETRFWDIMIEWAENSKKFQVICEYSGEERLITNSNNQLLASTGLTG